MRSRGWAAVARGAPASLTATSSGCLGVSGVIMIRENGAQGIDAMRSRQSTAAATGGGAPVAPAPIDAALIEEWALSYLGRYASSAESLRQVLRRRLRRRLGPGARIEASLAASIDALIVRYRASGLLDDAAYASGQARRSLAHGRSLHQIRARLAAK